MNINGQLVPSTGEMNSVFQRPPLKNVKDWMGRTVMLGDATHCFEKFGFVPGTILKTPNFSQQLEVVGIGQFDDLLWVRQAIGIKRRSFPFQHLHSQADFIQSGVNWITYIKKESNVRQIDDSNDSILQLQMMFRNQKECDIKFQVKNEIIGAHALILKNYEYFQSMLNGRFKESSGIVEITNFEPDDFKMCLEYLYTGKISIDEENILTVASFANFCCLEKLKEHCKQRMKEVLSPEYALAYFKQVFRTELFLVPIIESYVIENLECICREEKEEIVALSKEQLLYLAQIVSKEKLDVIFQMALIWLQHSDANIEKERFQCLAKEILPLLPKKDIDLSRYAKQLLPFIREPVQLQHFDQLLESVKDNQWMLAIAGEAFRFNNRIYEAQKSLWRALILNRHFAFALSRFAEIYRYRGDCMGAKKAFEKALLFELSAFTLGHYAVTLRQLGYLEEARKKFEDSIIAYKAIGDHIDEFVLFQYRETIKDLGCIGDVARVIRPRSATI